MEKSIKKTKTNQTYFYRVHLMRRPIRLNEIKRKRL